MRARQLSTTRRRSRTTNPGKPHACRSPLPTGTSPYPTSSPPRAMCLDQVASRTWRQTAPPVATFFARAEGRPAGTRRRRPARCPREPSSSRARGSPGRSLEPGDPCSRESSPARLTPASHAPLCPRLLTPNPNPGRAPPSRHPSPFCSRARGARPSRRRSPGAPSAKPQTRRPACSDPQSRQPSSPAGTPRAAKPRTASAPTGSRGTDRSR
mmetsp:Transcript_14628/g.57499  ORF Transcript_14628/g.57499 Transcript_14628/m.57499 type:complete len:212 (-) Transcript_14628:534-1169(-)